MKPLLKVSGLNAWYGESHILHGVDLTVGEGEMVTLLGRNGVGKTTTLRSIMGIVRKRKGEIRFAGADLMKVPLHRVAHHGLGFIPEERGIFSTLSVHENLLLPPAVASGGMTVDEIFELSRTFTNAAAAPERSFPAANSRCWRSPGSCVPACA